MQGRGKEKEVEEMRGDKMKIKEMKKEIEKEGTKMRDREREKKLSNYRKISSFPEKLKMHIFINIQCNFSPTEFIESMPYYKILMYWIYTSAFIHYTSS